MQILCCDVVKFYKENNDVINLVAPMVLKAT